MFTSCSQCGVGYSTSIGQCPACGSEYVPTNAEIAESLREDVFQQLVHGGTDEWILTWLQNHSPLPEELRIALLQEGKQRLRKVSRNRGLQLVALGILLGTVGAAVSAVATGIVGALGMMAVGMISFTIGAIKLVTGWNLADNIDFLTDYSPLYPITSPKDRELS